jgi:hypothetical protein
LFTVAHCRELSRTSNATCDLREQWRATLLCGGWAQKWAQLLVALKPHLIASENRVCCIDASIHLIPEVTEEARGFLASDSATAEELERVGALIEGFETPYGMELLTTVHWVEKHDPEGKVDWQDAVRLVHAWSDRKRRPSRRHIYGPLGVNDIPKIGLEKCVPETADRLGYLGFSGTDWSEVPTPTASPPNATTAGPPVKPPEIDCPNVSEIVVAEPIFPRL